MNAPPLQGSFRALHLFDVAEEIDPARLRAALQVHQPRREPTFRHRAPEYVRFERPPITEIAEPCAIEPGQPMQTYIRYFDNGVVSVQLIVDFKGSWPDWIALASRHMASEVTSKWAIEAVHKRLQGMPQILVKPYDGDWISEDYYLIQIEPIVDDAGAIVTARQLLAEHGADMAQMIRGESKALSDDERQEILSGAASYYATDLVLVGWTAALVYDTPEGAQPAVELIEFANNQLLNYRHYDLLLTQVLKSVYDNLDQGTGVWRRWFLAREATRLNTIRLDITELTERTDNALTFLSDMFDARVYRLAAPKVGVSDYRHLVEQKLQTAEELYTFMVDQFNEARAFVMEAMIVLILIVDMIVLFKDAF